MVYSPSTSATEMKAADRTPDQMLGSTTRSDHRGPAGAERPGRLGQRPHVDGASAASIDR